MKIVRSAALVVHGRAERLTEKAQGNSNPAALDDGRLVERDKIAIHKDPDGELRLCWDRQQRRHERR